MLSNCSFWSCGPLKFGIIALSHDSDYQIVSGTMWLVGTCTGFLSVPLYGEIVSMGRVNIW